MNITYRETEIDVVLCMLAYIIRETEKLDIKRMACTAFRILYDIWPYRDMEEIKEKCEKIGG